MLALYLPHPTVRWIKSMIFPLLSRPFVSLSFAALSIRLCFGLQSRCVIKEGSAACSSLIFEIPPIPSVSSLIMKPIFIINILNVCVCASLLSPILFTQTLVNNFFLSQISVSLVLHHFSIPKLGKSSVQLSSFPVSDTSLNVLP